LLSDGHFRSSAGALKSIWVSGMVGIEAREMMHGNTRLLAL
jgi:hypothetical protein